MGPGRLPGASVGSEYAPPDNMKYTMENDNQQQVKSFYRILEEGIAKLPADVRGALYRPGAVDCV